MPEPPNLMITASALFPSVLYALSCSIAEISGTRTTVPSHNQVHLFVPLN